MQLRLNLRSKRTQIGEVAGAVRAPAVGCAALGREIERAVDRWRPGCAGLSALAGCAGLLLAGCAAPGPPLPPTLNLPQIPAAASLSAVRIGDEVHLHWSTPAQTTDKLLVRGRVTAAICRDTPATPATPAAAGPQASSWLAAKMPCPSVLKLQVTAGASEAIDPLPATLTTGLPRLLAYRVELLNSAGRTAGPSAPVFAAAGAPLSPVAGFAAEPVKQGVRLHWQKLPSVFLGPMEIPTKRPIKAPVDQSTEVSIELERTLLDPAPQTSSPSPAGLPGEPRPQPATRFRAGRSEPSPSGHAPSDPGGAIDRTVEFGHTYRYTAQRVLKLELDGQRVELRSLDSPAVTLAVRDIFPPAVPTGLVAAPELAGDPPQPAIDLSWEPEMDPQLAGYRVYRRETGAAEAAWQRIGPDLITEPAFHDAAVAAGHQYAYRIAAASTAGNESAPGSETVETAPTP